MVVKLLELVIGMSKGLEGVVLVTIPSDIIR